MLLKLLPENITNNWNVIKYVIEESLPPVAGEGPDKMNRILEALLVGMAECWVYYKYSENSTGVEIKAMAITYVNEDFASRTKNLLLYVLFAFKPMSNEEWLEGLRGLQKYAKSKNCNRIIAYTEDARVLQLSRILKGESRYTFVTFPVNPLD